MNLFICAWRVIIVTFTVTVLGFSYKHTKRNYWFYAVQLNLIRTALFLHNNVLRFINRSSNAQI